MSKRFPGTAAAEAPLGGRLWAHPWASGLMPSLARRYPFAGFDHRGHGRTLLDASRFTIPDPAADALAVLDEPGIGKAVVCGFSLGGPAAARYFGANRHVPEFEARWPWLRRELARAPLAQHLARGTGGGRLRPARQARPAPGDPRHGRHHRR
ncbi:alpha/beta fold hydrolase [Amycolatopsis sp. NPDC024027]|uniref:alpha/beta fold hydrolase n=1 Tax=Amycolatopsis sp. NPDC024027 TaxID=3154327 RepID=UPI0034115326